MSKVRIPVEILPPPNENGDHILQFRVVSQDRNRTSEWSNLYILKSIGQYRPLESDYDISTASVYSGSVFVAKQVNLVWETPTIYNYSASLSSASIAHNHTQQYKQHDTDIFIKWNPSSSASYYEFHERISTDSTTIRVPAGKTSIEIVAAVATHNIPIQGEEESDSDYHDRLNTYVNKLISLFKVFHVTNYTIN